ncbi:MAG TPA: hypothetical protein VH184_23460 [Dongiaceae bacterium]|jgi:hypothetical protein|nr:hypothetical protein [Dongiaceae bacterium]
MDWEGIVYTTLLNRMSDTGLIPLREDARAILRAAFPESIMGDVLLRPPFRTAREIIERLHGVIGAWERDGEVGLKRESQMAPDQFGGEG